MKISFLFWALMAAVAATAQVPTTVDRVTSTLDSLTIATFDGWKMSPDLKTYRVTGGHPSEPAFDDGSWTALSIGQSVYPDSCWLRKVIVVPNSILGQPVAGPLTFAVSVDDFGYFWSNGSFRGEFPWEGEFLLTQNGIPGERIVIAIKAVNTGGPLRLLRAELRMAATGDVRQRIADFCLSLRTGQKLLSFDTYQSSAGRRVDPKTDRSTVDRAERTSLQGLLQSLASRVDVDALRAGALDRFTRSVDAIRPELKPIADFARRFTLYFDANAHIDAAWLWREKETVEVCKNTFSSVLNMMRSRPDFTYTQSSAAYYAWMEERYPDIFRGMADRIRDGRWEIIGGMWVEPDCNLPSGESWTRQLLYGKGYFREKFGVDVTIGWNPDSFGYNGNMPMLYRNAGITAFITQKIGWNDTNVFPHRLFWWESADGSRILSYFPFDYVNTVEDPLRLVDWARQYEANTGLRSLMILFGVGDHGGGPSLEMLTRIDRLAHLDIFPRIEHGTAGGYLTWLRAQDLSTLPVWKDELYLEYHQGTYTTQAGLKKANRVEEALLTNAEKFSSFASLYGRPYHRADLREGWVKLLFTQFHDILPGSCIREVVLDAGVTHGEVQEIARHEFSGAVETIAKQVNTSKTAGTPLLVFNALSWARTDLVRFPLPHGSDENYAVFDVNGKEIPSQIVTEGKYNRTLLFIARDVPPLGYATVDLRTIRRPAAAPIPPSGTLTIANGLFTVTADPKTGWLSGIRDERNGRELLSGPGNELQLLEDLPSQYDAWNIGWTGVTFPSTFRSGRVIEQGPVRTVLRLERDYLKPGRKKEYPTEYFPSSFFTQDVVLYRDLDRIDFVTRVEWWEEKTMLKVAFPLTVEDTVATYEIPFGTIRRSTLLRNSWEKAKVEVPASRWADVSASGAGVSLLNTGKYGYDVKGKTIRLSLLRSPKWPDPLADRGTHVIEYSLYPHRGNWREGKTVQRGYEVNVPLTAVAAGRHRGSLPSALSFVQLAPEDLVLTSIKRAEVGEEWVIQWYNLSDQPREALLTLPRPVRAAEYSNFLEEKGKPAMITGSTVRCSTPPNGVVTLRCSF